MLPLILIILQLFSLGSTANLIQMQAIWRHGDRAPGELPYPKDRYNETYWPRGWDQLTNKGIWQSVELGIWLRQRYGSTVLPVFNKDKVLILSSESERAIETAQGVAAGLFPPMDDRVWESSYLRYWQPTPIQTAYGTIDAILRPTKINCPNYDVANEREEAAIAAQVNSEYGQMFNWLQNTTGMESIDFWNINDLYDIQREIDHNMPQPQWLNQVFNGSTIMDHIRELKRVTRNQEFNSPTKAKFRGGMLVNKFLENMEDLKANKTTKEAMMYSSHDGTLSALLYALNVSNDELVPYTATVLFELYDDDTVQLFYKNTTTTAYPLTIPGCAQICPYSQFMGLLEGVRVRSLEDLYKICGTYSSSTSFSTPVPSTPTSTRPL